MDYRKPFRVKPGKKVRLNKLDPGYTGKLDSDLAAKEETEHYLKTLARQQALLYAERKHSVLVVLQGMDAAGKDGTIEHVFKSSIRRGSPSPASSSRRRSNSRTTFSGGSTPRPQEPGKSSFSTGRTTRTFW